MGLILSFHFYLSVVVYIFWYSKLAITSDLTLKWRAARAGIFIIYVFYTISLSPYMIK